MLALGVLPFTKYSLYKFKQVTSLHQHWVQLHETNRVKITITKTRLGFISPSQKKCRNSQLKAAVYDGSTEFLRTKMSLNLQLLHYYEAALVFIMAAKFQPSHLCFRKKDEGKTDWRNGSSLPFKTSQKLLTKLQLIAQWKSLIIWPHLPSEEARKQSFSWAKKPRNCQ